jgi:hypothetical protein
MERRCRSCGDPKGAADYASFVDAYGMTLTESVCNACKKNEQKPKAPKTSKAARTVVLKPELKELPRATYRLTPAQREECKELLKAYKMDIDGDPVALISSACVFTGVRPAMCLDLQDHRRPARGDNVIPCAYHVRAARGAMKADDFVRLCRGVAEKHVLDARRAREALAMSARYAAAGGSMFGEMCMAVSRYDSRLKESSLMTD